MRRLVWTLLAGWVAAAPAGCQSGAVRPDRAQTGTRPAPQTGARPAPRTGGANDAEPLLLLDLAGGADSPQRAASAADNSRCFVCHLNYMKESMAVVHARARISCVKCHGDCDAHIADESWASGGNGTPPAIMYTRTEVNASCFHCHPAGKLNAASHEPFLAGMLEERYCTDCHGAHRLAKRKCKWK